MSKYDNYGGAPFEEPDYEDSREIVAFYYERDGKLEFWRYESLTTLNEEHSYPDDISELLTPDERDFFLENEPFPLEPTSKPMASGRSSATTASPSTRMTPMPTTPR